MASTEYLIERVATSYVSGDSNIPTAYRNNNILATPTSPTTTAVNLYGYNIYNPNASEVFVKFYNKATAPTVGADTIVMTLQVSAGGSIVLFGSDIIKRFTTRMYFAITTGYLDTNAVAPALGCLVQLNYK